MPQITIDDMKDHAAELVRAVREQQIEYVIVEDGAPVAMLAPSVAPGSTQESNSLAGILQLLDTWRTDDPNDELPLDDFLAFLEQNRLDLDTEV